MASNVKWYDENVKLVVSNAMDDILTAAAFQVEGHAKVDAPVDTGFMRNAIYTIAADGDSTRSKTDPDHDHYTKASEPPKEKHVAMVHAAASYTIYNEMRQSFLYKALKTVQREIGGIIKTVAKEKNLD